jgi:hypothetical protein
MDERLKKALEFASYRHTLSLEKKRLKEKLKYDLTIAHNGGIFYITRNFLSFLTLLNDSEPESVVLLDDREVPILIDNFSEFRNSAIQKYFRVTNQYYLDFEAIRKKRTVKDLVDL